MGRISCEMPGFATRQIRPHTPLSLPNTRLFAPTCCQKTKPFNLPEEKAAGLLGVIRCADWSSRLCRWDSSSANEKVAQTFSNQALNTMYNFASRGLLALNRSWFIQFSDSVKTEKSFVETIDAMSVHCISDIWITDPPYADAVHYHELTEFPLSWIEKNISNVSSKWFSSTKSTLAVKG